MIGLMWTYGSAQTRPDILLEDLDENSLSIKCYCKPGVRNKTKSKGLEISYQFVGDGEISAPNGEFSAPNPTYSKFRKFRTKLSLPVINGPQFKTIIGVSYSAEQYELEDTGNDFMGLVNGTDNVNFKSSALDLAMSYAPNAVNYIGVRFKTSFNGSYEGLVDISSRFAIYSGAVAFGIKKHEDNEFGFGIAGSRNFREQGFMVLPFAFWNKTINDKWGFQLTFPTSYQLRYNLNAKSIIVLGANYNGESYSYDQASTPDFPIAFNHSEILTLVRLERQIVPWLWFDIHAGFHFNFNSEFESQVTNEDLLSIDPGNNIVLKIGLFISPPDSFLK